MRRDLLSLFLCGVCHTCGANWDPERANSEKGKLLNKKRQKVRMKKIVQFMSTIQHLPYIARSCTDNARRLFGTYRCCRCCWWPYICHCVTSSLAASAVRQKCIKATLVANRSSQTDRTSNREKTKQKQETRIKTYRLYFRVYVSLGLNTPSIHDRTSLYLGGKKRDSNSKLQAPVPCLWPNPRTPFPFHDPIVSSTLYSSSRPKKRTQKIVP